MRTDLKLFCVPDTLPIREGLQRLNENQLRILLLVDENQRLKGTVTDGDIRRCVLANISLDAPLSVLMDRKRGTEFANPITAPMGLTAKAYAKIFQKHQILHLPVIDKENRVVGLHLLDDLLDEPASLPVHAIVMAGGSGQRLRPLTNELPKPMLPVGEKPLMETMLEQLRQSGIERVSISTHYMQDKIKSHFGSGESFGLKLSYLNEDRPMGTAGALRLVDKAEDTLLVLNGDVLTGLDFRKMISFHREHAADMTIAVRKYDVQVPYGVVECQDFSVQGVTEKPIFNFFVNAGIYLIERKVIPQNKKADRLDMTEVIDGLLRKGQRVISFPILEQWIDIGRPEDYDQAQRIVQEIQKR